ncbi:MAG: zinc-ribbon domain-containing protein [Candidatus Symbiothrix sp.]|nr:zinc-ribbon domain-containing protein [Candidatus Symbiothrix sp.]
MACEEEYTSPIPDLPVSISFNLLFEQDLKNLTGFPKIIREQPIGMRQGFGGVLIVHGVGDTDPPLFAFDLACPHEADRSVTVIPDSAGKARCPKCGSVFVTLWGTGMPEGQSVSRYPLKSYRLTIQNTTCLISN